jgi:hypothetical protein
MLPSRNGKVSVRRDSGPFRCDNSGATPAPRIVATKKLAVGGETGAATILRLLRDELDLAMALAGAPTVADITRDLVRR